MKIMHTNTIHNRHKHYTKAHNINNRFLFPMVYTRLGIHLYVPHQLHDPMNYYLPLMIRVHQDRTKPYPI